MSHGGGGGPVAVVMRRPDGTPMTRNEVVRERRGAFKWLPVLFSNDLVHGSWWFVLGSLLSMIIALVPLADPQEQTDDSLPRLDKGITWSLLVICGFFYTVGSYAFARAFEEPPKLPLFHYIKHLQSDELLGAWLFLFGTLPAVPWSLVYFSIFPSFTYMALFIMAIAAVIACCLFVVACYPSDRKVENYLLPFCVQVCGSRIWIVKHLANDWLAGTWFFLWISGLFTLGSFAYFCIALSSNASSQLIFVYTAGLIDSILFLIGSLYFVSGSYPHASQFYYAINNTAAESKAEKRKIHKYSKTANEANDVEKSVHSDPSGIVGTKSQTMDFRLTTSINPLHDQPVLSSAGHIKDKVTSSTIAEIHDKLLVTVNNMKKGNSSANLLQSGSTKMEIESASNSVTNPLHGDTISIPVNPKPTTIDVIDDDNQEDDDAEIEDHQKVDVSSPLHFVTESKKVIELKKHLNG